MFRFKQFTVCDERSAMKIGTDGVLLGAWADIEDDSRILDVGTGTGLIALMLAQRNTSANIMGIDISCEATQEACDNFGRSPWAERLSAVCGDVCSFESNEKFDHIVSNPPYFVDSLHSPDKLRTMARHTSSLKFEDLVTSAVRLLRPGGRLSVILPTECAMQFRFAAFGRLWLRRQLEVVTKAGDTPRRTLMEFCLSDKPLMPSVATLIMRHKDSSYTDEYRALTNDFYISLK
ncbi:MAG: methyltransferase [Alistipes sp.]|nr:methyltransferase [Alistipes sp.]